MLHNVKGKPDKEITSKLWKSYRLTSPAKKFKVTQKYNHITY